MTTSPRPYFDEGVECATLGAMIAADTRERLVAITRELPAGADEFHREDHRLIYSAILEVARDGGLDDPALLRHHLEQNGNWQAAGGWDRLTACIGFVAHALHGPKYAREVHRHYLARRAASVNLKIKTAIDNGQIQEIPALAAELEKLGTPVESAPYRPVHDLAADPVFDFGYPATTSGFRDLDEALGGGFRPACLYSIAGVTGKGKSTLLLNVALRAARRGVSVLLIRLEQSGVESLWRPASMISDLPLLRLLDGLRAANQDVLRLRAEALGELSSLPIALCEERALAAVESAITRHAMEFRGKKRLVLIDQFSHVVPPEGTQNSYEAATMLSHRLRDLAKNTRTPVVVLHQGASEIHVAQPPSAVSFGQMTRVADGFSEGPSSKPRGREG